jgi:uncharacterized membrane protein YkvA (DUF1232 family)
MAKLEIRKRMKNLLTFLPNLVRLCGRLLKDSRVPTTEKVLVAAAIIYAIAPLDFLPDFIPFLGQVDDAYLIALTLLRLINRTDESIVREHWSGGSNIRQLTESLAELAPRVLPQRIVRVLSSRVIVRTDSQNPNRKVPVPMLVEVSDE